MESSRHPAILALLQCVISDGWRCAEVASRRRGARARERAHLREARSAIGAGGDAETAAHCAYFLAGKGKLLPPGQPRLKAEFDAARRDRLPAIPPGPACRIRGEQEASVGRVRPLQLPRQLFENERVRGARISVTPVAMLVRICAALGARPRLAIKAAVGQARHDDRRRRLRR
jgi:hypothetical protein